MERRAPVSSVVRARCRSCGEVLGVGRRALRLRSCRLAVERREAILSGEGGGEDCSCVNVVFSPVVDMLGDAPQARASGENWLRFVLPKAEALTDTSEMMERSAIIAGRKPARITAEKCPTLIHTIPGICFLWITIFLYLLAFVDTST